MMYQSFPGLANGMSSLSDIGVSTGAATGTTPSAATLSGALQLNTSTLAAAIQSNPTGVQSLLLNFGASFSARLGIDAGFGGTLQQRITAAGQQSAQMSSQITDMEQTLTDQQSNLQAEFAALASAIQSSQNTSSWLTSQLAQFNKSSG
jgi:flagellar hook-associated protein 2